MSATKARYSYPFQGELVSFLAGVEQGEAVDEIQTQRFYEEYEHYVNRGGNSYIKQKVQKLKDKNLI